MLRIIRAFVEDELSVVVSQRLNDDGVRESDGEEWRARSRSSGGKQGSGSSRQCFEQRCTFVFAVGLCHEQRMLRKDGVVIGKGASLKIQSNALCGICP